MGALGNDFSPFSTETLGSSSPFLSGLFSRCTQSKVQNLGIVYPSFSQCSMSRLGIERLVAFRR